MALDADQIVQQRQMRRRVLLWRALTVIALTALVVVAVSSNIDGPGVSSKDRIARIVVSGIIVDDRYREQMLADLKENDAVKAVIVRIDSPGGTVVGGEALYLGLRDLAAQKPVVAVMGSTATSAAYMTALASDHIIAREGTVTGSIGVLMQTADISRLLDTLGITPETVRSGPFKALPNPTEPMSAEVRGAISAVVMDMYDMFVAMVGERRGLDAVALKRVSDGRVFTGRQALAEGLIDAIGGEADAVKWLESEQNVAPDLPVRDAKPDYPKDDIMAQLLGATGKALFSERVILDGLLSVWHPEL